MGFDGTMFLMSTAALGFAFLSWWLTSRFELVLRVPVSGSVDIDEPVSVALEVPIEMVLTESEIDLSQLELPLDTDLFVDGLIDLDTTIPIATNVMTPVGISVPIKAKVPIKASIPLRQSLHVRERLKLEIEHVHIPVRTRVPVQVSFALRQSFRFSTTVEVPIRHRSVMPTLRLKPERCARATGERESV